MSSKVIRTLLRGCAVVLALAVVAPRPADAAEKKKPAKAAPVVDQKTGQKLNKAVELLNADKNVEAREILESLAKNSSLSPYERARTENLLAVVSQSEKKYGEAREHLQKALDSGGLNDQEISQNKFGIAQLFLADEKWKEGAKELEEWFASGATPNSNAYYLLAIAYYQMKQVDKAIEPAEKAIALAEKPQESWLQLLLALRIEKEQYTQALPIVRRLIEAQPTKKEYWVQYSSINSMMEKYDDALMAIQVAYNGGLLNQESEYRRLTDLLIHANIPFRAAFTLQKLLDEKKISGDSKDWEKLGNAWIGSRNLEKALPPLNKAASLADNGNLYVRIAEVQVEREQWDKAIEAVTKANEKGGLKSPADAQLVMGIALFNQKRLGEAKKYFLLAAQDEKNASQAKGWLRYIESEQKAGSSK